MKKTVNLNPSLQLNNEKPGKRCLYFYKYGRVFENQCLCKKYNAFKMAINYK